MKTLFMDWKESTVAPYLVDGVSIEKLGGDLHRETPQANSNNLNSTNRAASLFSRAFCYHASEAIGRIHQYDPDAYKVALGTYSNQTNFNGFQKDNTWSASGGATGHFVENGVSTDGHMLLAFDTGSSIGLGETITITNGPANTETAVTTEAATQGGSPSQLGENKVVKAFTNTMSRISCTMQPVVVNGVDSIAVVARRSGSSTIVDAMIYDVITDTWTEYLSVGTIAAGSWGMSYVLNDSIYCSTANSTTFGQPGFVFNPSTVVFGPYDLAQASTGADRELSDAQPMGYYKAQIFNATPNQSSLFAMKKLSGAGFATLYTMAAHSGFSPSTNQQARGGLLVEHGNKLWVFPYNDVAIDGWSVLCFSIRDNFLVCENYAKVDPGYGFDAQALAARILPSALAAGIGAPNTGIGIRWRHIRNQVTNNPDGQDTLRLYHIGDSNGGITELLEWGAVFSDLTVVLDWANAIDQTGGVWRVPVTSGTPSSELTANVDWVRDRDHGGSEEGVIFRVVTVNDGSAYIEVENPNDAEISLPSANTTPQKLVPPTSVGTTAGIAHMAFPDGNEGGGGKVFFNGIKSGVIKSTQNQVNKQRITMMFNGGGTISCKLYHGEAPDRIMDSESTISKPAGETWTLASNEMTNVPADASDVLVDHEAAIDLIDNGALIRRCNRTV